MDYKFNMDSINYSYLIKHFSLNNSYLNDIKLKSTEDKLIGKEREKLLFLINSFIMNHILYIIMNYLL